MIVFSLNLSTISNAESVRYKLIYRLYTIVNGKYRNELIKVDIY